MSILTDTENIKLIIKNSGFKLKYLAKQLNLSRYGLQLKLENKNEFKPSEIVKLCDILKITDLRLKEQLFFAQNVDDKSQKSTKEM